MYSEHNILVFGRELYLNYLSINILDGSRHPFWVDHQYNRWHSRTPGDKTTTSSLTRPYSIRFPLLNCIGTFGIDGLRCYTMNRSMARSLPGFDTYISFFSIVRHALGQLGCIVTILASSK